MEIPFSPPDVGEEEIREVADTLRSGWITTGPKTKRLEKEIAEAIGVGTTAAGTPRCVALNSQTACAEMALRTVGIGPGDEVIVPAYTYTASASVVCHVGATLKIVDVQKDRLEPDYDAVENAVTERTKAIIPVDLGGVPCDYDKLFSVVEATKEKFRPAGPIQEALGRIAVMADTAHAFGAEWHGKKIGNVADFSSFSFHAVKNFTTGEGGCLTWRDIPGVDSDEIYHTLQLLSLHGQSRDALNKTRPGAWEYDVVAPLYKCNMTDIAASIGLAQFRRYPGMLARRREIISRYDAAFRPLGVRTLPHYTADYSSSGHLYITRVFDKAGKPVDDGTRREIIAKLAEQGVSANVHYKPLPMLTAYRDLGFDIKDFPNARAQYENEITLPLHTCLTDEMVDYVIEKYTKIIGETVG
ncbi:MAG: DegT/DnrJ/EryC1/StrS aminotransferase family protein [Clostridia bacterium]|nr:DegT/DnrJ/EryC1/StrS aminotransferase family protein [Clostridia bacterium]